MASPVAAAVEATATPVVKPTVADKETDTVENEVDAARESVQRGSAANEGSDEPMGEPEGGGDEHAEGGDQGSRGGGGGGNCAPLEEFASPVTDFEYIDFLISPGSHQHSVIKPHGYIILRPEVVGLNEGRGVPVYAPVDSTLVSVAFYRTNKETVDEFMLTFRVNCEVTYRFDHVRTVIDEIVVQMPDQPSSTSHDFRLNPTVEFKAGDIIGWTGGTGQAHAFDFGVYNTARTNQFANPDRYVASYNFIALNADCGWEYFTAELRDQYIPLLGTFASGAMGRDTCRKPERDVVGTVAGAWFAPDSGIESAFAIAAEIDGSVTMGARDFEVRVYADDPTHRLPADITDLHCYEGAQMTAGTWAYLELLEDGRLAVAHGRGGCPVELPTDHEIYAR